MNLIEFRIIYFKFIVCGIQCHGFYNYLIILSAGSFILKECRLPIELRESRLSDKFFLIMA